MIDEREWRLLGAVKFTDLSRILQGEVVYLTLGTRFLADELFKTFFFRDPFTVLVAFALPLPGMIVTAEAADGVGLRLALFDFNCFRSCFNVAMASLQSGSKYLGTFARFS